MLHSLLAFLPVAAVLTLTPGVATALVVRSAVRGGRREALLVTAGNSLGVLAWAVFAAVGVAAVVAASAELFTTIKLAGALVLVILGLQGLLARKTDAPPPPPGRALRVGLVTSLANPKLAVFFVALFPRRRARRPRRAAGARAALEAHSSTAPDTHVTVPPPTQIAPSSADTWTRPRRPSAVPWRAT